MAESSEIASNFLTSWGPKENVEYPIEVHYCGVCGIPIEFCEFSPQPAKCKEWLENKLPDLFARLHTEQSLSHDTEELDDGKKKRQKRGGGAKKVKANVEAKKIILWTSKRGKKRVTFIKGLSTYDISLKEASKWFGSKFACGSSITGEDEVLIQGDVKDDLFDLLSEKWSQIEEESIEDLGEKK